MDKEPIKEGYIPTENSVSLVGISENEEINKDARFLDEMRKLFYLYEKREPSGNSVQVSNAKLEKMKEKQKYVAMAF